MPAPPRDVVVIEDSSHIWLRVPMGHHALPTRSHLDQGLLHEVFGEVGITAQQEGDPREGRDPCLDKVVKGRLGVIGHGHLHPLHASTVVIGWVDGETVFGLRQPDTSLRKLATVAAIASRAGPRYLRGSTW